MTLKILKNSITPGIPDQNKIKPGRIGEKLEKNWRIYRINPPIKNYLNALNDLNITIDLI